ncbi:hypothetical protein [Hymenobacter crusticola]|uniref:Uncharacterized protein n=1 Tax=Hymenobacter crusticola TaxID=1770526 RepID=A0A243WCL6_9BACT|nr:hypothetical protein [Hymenobacter crusticola]OUJ73288.1 hypothetical protein BXP70_15855 [Hymenobacter crusticola]
MKRYLSKNLGGYFGLLLIIGLLASCQQHTTDPQQYLGDPKVGDVYVIQFHPTGDTARRYYFYKLYRVTNDSALFHPARKEETRPGADVSGADFFAATQTLGYTRQELPSLLKEEPGDALKTKLVGIRRE